MLVNLQDPMTDTFADDGLEGWRCVRTKSKSEHIAARQLGLLPDVEVFCPRIRYQKVTRRGKIWFNEALFPSYVFCHFNLGQSLRAVQATGGVTGLVRFGEDYPTLDGSIVEDLRKEFGTLEPVTIRLMLEIGDEIEVVDGPLKGTVAPVTAIPNGGERVRILLDFLGQEREVEIPILSLLGFRSVREFLPGENN